MPGPPGAGPGSTLRSAQLERPMPREGLAAANETHSRRASADRLPDRARPGVPETGAAAPRWRSGTPVTAQRTAHKRGSAHLRQTLRQNSADGDPPAAMPARTRPTARQQGRQWRYGRRSSTPTSSCGRRHWPRTHEGARACGGGADPAQPGLTGPARAAPRPATRGGQGRWRR
jgi:hypothetical protein